MDETFHEYSFQFLTSNITVTVTFDQGQISLDYRQQITKSMLYTILSVCVKSVQSLNRRRKRNLQVDPFNAHVACTISMAVGIMTGVQEFRPSRGLRDKSSTDVLPPEKLESRQTDEHSPLHRLTWHFKKNKCISYNPVIKITLRIHSQYEDVR